jgi:hypothetical protein
VPAGPSGVSPCGLRGFWGRLCCPAGKMSLVVLSCSSSREVLGVRGRRPRGQWWPEGSWLLAGPGDGGFLPAPVGLAVDDQFVGGGLEPVDG